MLAANPVSFEGDKFADAAFGEHQQAGKGDGLRAMELVASPDGVETAHFLAVRNRSLGSIPYLYRLAFLQGLELWGRYPQSSPMRMMTDRTGMARLAGPGGRPWTRTSF